MSAGPRSETNAAAYLGAKLFWPPARAHLVGRPHLLRRLADGLLHDRRLTLICAPAGYGKTTLAVAWLDQLRGEQQKAPHLAWLALDEGDNRLLRFIEYVMAALEQAGLPQLGQTRNALYVAAEPDAASVTAAFVQELTQLGACTDAKIILVLDDYHRIENPAVHRLLQTMIECPLPALHIVLLTRGDPPLSLARWRVQGTMTEVRARDLRFSAAEAEEFLNRIMSLSLSSEIVTALATRTEGWIAGLQLAALTLQSRTDGTEFVAQFSGDHRQVADYLMIEVISCQPPAVQHFLLVTSILERMCGSLCAALLATDGAPGSADSQVGQAMLEDLERRNLFVVPLDDQRIWYRYHHLFGELLQQHLQLKINTDAIKALHRAAAEWHAGQGLATSAVRHALASNDHDLAAALVERALAKAATWSGGNVSMLFDWWHALPTDILNARPLLCLRISRALYLSGHLRDADRLLDATEQALHKKTSAPDDLANLLAQAAIYRAAIWAMQGEAQRALDVTEAALGDLSPSDRLPRARAYDTLGLAHELLGDADEAADRYLDASVLAEQAGVLYLAVNARCEAAQVQVMQGRLGQAASMCRAAIELGEADDPEMPPLGLAWSLLGHVQREQNELATAERSLHWGIELSKRGGIVDDLRHEYLYLAQLHQAQGKLAEALATLQQAELLIRVYMAPRLLDRIAAQRTRIWLAQGQLDAAAHWADQFAAREPAAYLQEYEALTVVRVNLAQRQAEAASSRLDRIRPAAEASGRMGTVIECWLLAALAQDLGNDPAALDALRRAVALAAPEGHVRLFLDEGPPLIDLLRRLTMRPDCPTYARQLLRHADQEKSAVDTAAVAHLPEPPVGDRPNAELLEPLTERELEVLGLLAERLTNAEIAQRLIISLPTVKSHTAHIYAKLDVGDRRAAVARAHSLGLLPDS